MIPHDRLTFIGRTDFRDSNQLFGIKTADRRFHMYVIGQTGTGKSSLLETLIRQDAAHGQGLAVLDPHGDLVERIVRHLPAHRRGDLVYLDAPDPTQPYGVNPLAGVPIVKRPLAASGLLEVMKKLWSDSWGPRLEHIVRNTFLALLDQPHATIADAMRLLSDDDYRRHAMTAVRSQPVRAFWLKEYEKYPAKFRLEAIAPIQNKVGAFLANPLLHRILTRAERMLDLRRIMDDGKILLVNLAKGRIGEDTATLLGALIVTSLGVAAMSRSDVAEDDRRDFFVYLDEFHAFTTLSLAGMLSELRKYGVGLVLAHQYLAQLDPLVREAILGNAGTIMSFRVGPEDADLLAQEFGPTFSALDMINLPNRHIYLKLMVDGVPSPPFSARTFRLPD
ncbi:type IV secretion system DNA-binding domain-containing protein [bacterium]|nr:type IV secretion system DNA-binding domain-containing protein [bacterium]